MRIRTVFVSAVIGAAMVAGAAAPAAAQGHATDLSLGYQFTRAIDDSTNLPKGWTASLSRHFNPVASIVGEASGAYKDGVSVHFFQAGLRFGNFDNPNITPFGQILVGSGTFSSSGTSSTGINFQPGGGVDLRANDTVSVRLQGDYLVTRVEGVNSKAFRFAASVVFSLTK